MASNEAHNRATINYNRSRDNIMLRPTKEEGSRIRESAAAAGMSVQAYCLEAIREHMKKGK